MKVVFDPEYDMGFVDFTEQCDGDHSEKPFEVDEDGNVVAFSMDNLSQGVDLTDPRLPKQHLPELARRLRRKGYKVILEKPEPALKA